MNKLFQAIGAPLRALGGWRWRRRRVEHVTRLRAFTPPAPATRDDVAYLDAALRRRRGTAEAER